jgi:dipeptidyl aminopeptidase/acylaminoacyl peptidase
MSNKIKWGLRVLGGAAALVLLGIGVNFFVAQLQRYSAAAAPTPLSENVIPIVTPNAEKRLLAFTIETNGETDVYTVRADGSELNNLTGAFNGSHPYWSPDGKRIAFLSNRSGHIQIFTMNADGSGLFQVTHSPADHAFTGANPWSPDGNALVFIEKTSDGKQVLYTIQTDGRNSLLLDNQARIYQSASWSPDSRSIAYLTLETVGEQTRTHIYVIPLKDRRRIKVTQALPGDEDLDFIYQWTAESNLRFAAARTYAENGNTQFTYYEATPDGATLAQIVQTSTPFLGWWNGITLTRNFSGEILTWLHPDGSFNQFTPFQNCETGAEPDYYSLYSVTADGYSVFGARCPNGDLWLYWANPKGTDIRPLLASPLQISGGDLDGAEWSTDGQHLALTITASGLSRLYLLHLHQALQTPLTLKEAIPLGSGYMLSPVSWQP